MKISIAFSDQEARQAGRAVDALMALFRLKVKETPLRDGYRHYYLEVMPKLSSKIT